MKCDKPEIFTEFVSNNYCTYLDLRTQALNLDESFETRVIFSALKMKYNHIKKCKYSQRCYCTADASIISIFKYIV